MAYHKIAYKIQYYWTKYNSDNELLLVSENQWQTFVQFIQFCTSIIKIILMKGCPLCALAQVCLNIIKLIPGLRWEKYHQSVLCIE
jgi:hypothetical protein